MQQIECVAIGTIHSGTEPMQKSLEMEASASRKREEADRSGSMFMETAMLEQRIRMEEYKTNFEMLRAQHIRLQEVCKMPRFLIILLNYARKLTAIFFSTTV